MKPYLNHYSTIWTPWLVSINWIWKPGSKPDLPGRYWLKACSPDWLGSLWSYTWFRSLVNWHPPPEMEQKAKVTSDLTNETLYACVGFLLTHLCPLLSELLLLKSSLLPFLLQFLNFLHTVRFPPCWKEQRKTITTKSNSFANTTWKCYLYLYVSNATNQ